MKKYVLGFLFTNDLEKVVLILKNKPEWQKGSFNGVGGKIEEGETPLQAMTREFKEEAGLEIITWSQFLIMRGIDWEVYCFKAFKQDADVKTMTDETVFVADIQHIDTLPTIQNLSWMIPMCLDFDDFTGEITKNAARLIALKEYFDYLIEFEFELSDEIKSYTK